MGRNDVGERKPGAADGTVDCLICGYRTDLFMLSQMRAPAIGHHDGCVMSALYQQSRAEQAERGKAELQKRIEYLECGERDPAHDNCRNAEDQLVHQIEILREHCAAAERKGRVEALRDVIRFHADNNPGTFRFHSWLKVQLRAAEEGSDG